MNADDMVMLWLYEREFWPTFEIPSEDERLMKIKEQAWMDLLADVPADEVRGAIANLSRTREFPPNPGQIREHINQMKSRAEFQRVLDEMYPAPPTRAALP